MGGNALVLCQMDNQATAGSNLPRLDNASLGITAPNRGDVVLLLISILSRMKLCYELLSSKNGILALPSILSFG